MGLLYVNIIDVSVGGKVKAGWRQVLLSWALWGAVLAHRPDALLASQGGGFIAAAGLMNVKTVDEQPRKQQRQQACHKNDGDHFLHNFIPFPGELNLLLFVFARDFRSVWVKILVLIPFFALHAAWIGHGDAGKSRALTRRSYCRTPRA